MQSLSKFLGIFSRNKKRKANIDMKSQGTLSSQNQFEQKNKGRDLTQPNFKHIRKATNGKRLPFWHDRCVDQWKRRDSPDTNPHLCSQITFNTGSKT